MKNKKGFLFLIAFTFCLFADAQAQERRISEQEMTAIRKKSVFKNKAYRLKSFAESFSSKDGKPNFFSDETTEYAANGDSHTVLEGGRSRENITRTETIKVGMTIYNLMPDGKWRSSPLIIKKHTEEQLQRLREDQPEIVSTEHFYKGKVTLGGQKLDLYESKIIQSDKYNRSLRTVIQKNWFNQDGILVRIEESSNNEAGSANRLFEITLDPNIKIEAPVNIITN